MAIQITSKDQQSGLIGKLFLATARKYDTPGYDFDVNIVRAIVCLFFIWKLLSRDFGFYGHVPAEVFTYYPINIYPAKSYVLTTGLPIISDLATLHWVHWIIPRPDETVLRILQAAAIVLLVAHLVFGRGPRAILAIGCYAILIYLWGHLFLAGHEVDAVLLYFGLLIILITSSHRDRPLWRLHSLAKLKANVTAGRTISRLFLLFVAYYFASGVNKLTDLTFAQWFAYDLAEAMHMYRIRADYGFISVPHIFEPLYNVALLKYVGPPLVYLSHLVTPLVYFYRSQVFKFFLFYALFHFLAFGVGISFTGYVLVWFVLFPYHALIFGGVPAPFRGGAHEQRS
ncbi:MAG: hypothetical protein AAGB04_15190 [Pseudomonadota bacterium]